SQDGAADAADAAHPAAWQGHVVAVDHTAPAVLVPDELVLEELVALDHGAADDRVQSGAVATGGQNSDLHGRSSLPSGTSRRGHRRGHRWGGGVARWPGRAGTSRHERAAAPTLRSEAALRRRGRLWRPGRQAVRAAPRPHRTHAAAPALRADSPGRPIWLARPRRSRPCPGPGRPLRDGCAAVVTRDRTRRGPRARPRRRAAGCPGSPPRWST